MKVTTLVVCVSVALSAAETARGQVRNWATPADGLWRTAGNWNPANVPDTTGEIALLGLTGAYNVSLQGDSFQVGGVQITNPLAELRIFQSSTVSFTVLNIVGDLTNDGVVRLPVHSSTNTARLQFLGDGRVISGTGEIRLEETNDTDLLLRSGANVTQEAGHRITGTGRLFSEGGGTLTNFGTLLGNRAGGLYIDCPVHNHAALRAVSPGGLSMRGMVEQFGPAAFVEGDGADVTLGHNSDIDGGVVRGVNGGVVTVAPGAEAYLSNVTSEGDWVIPNSVNTTLVVGTAWTNNGLVRLAAHAASSNSVLQIDTDGLVIHGTGEVRLEESFDTLLYLTGTVTNGPGHTISGVGRIYGGAGEFRNQGTLSPGAPVGTLTLQNSAVLEPTSVLRIEVGDDTDILDTVGWSITLGGTLKVELRDGVELAPCTELYVVRGDLSGTFDTYDLPVMPQGLMHVVYLASEVKISYIPGDLNGDGLLDFADYLEFLNLFDAQDPRADLNGDGLVDFGDYLEFLNLFDGGC